MKTCGYCGRTYDDSESKCPSCGSTLLRHSSDAAAAAADYDRIKQDIEGKRKSKSKIVRIIAAVLALIVIIIISTVVKQANDPQRDIDLAAKDKYEAALKAVDDGDYDLALVTLGAIDESWSDYSKAASLKQRAVSEKLREKADDYMAKGQYEEMLWLIVSNVNADDISSDPELSKLYASAADCYREQVIAEGEKAYTQNGYQAAISAINEGLSILNGDAILQAEKDKYSAFAPVDLTSVTPYYIGTVEIFTGGETDTLGNTYSTGMRGYMSTSDGTDCYAVWDLGGKYNKLTATGIVLESDKSSKCKGSYKIYGDGVLLYEKSGVGSMTKPYQIEVDITGVTDLKIEMYGQGNMSWSGIDSVLVDIMVQKTK